MRSKVKLGEVMVAEGGWVMYFNLKILRVLREVDEGGFGRFSLDQVFDSVSSFIFRAGAIGFVARKSINALSEL